MTFKKTDSGLLGDYVRERYGMGLAEYIANGYAGVQAGEIDASSLRPTKVMYRTADGRTFHFSWVAEQIREAATTLLTHAQIREEEAIENLVRAKNACDDTVTTARAVLEAAQAVEKLEQHVESMTHIIDQLDPPATPTADLTYPSDAAGTDEDEPKTGDCDA